MKPNASTFFTIPFWVHIIAFVQLMFNHLVTADLQGWTSDIHPPQRHSERRETNVSLLQSPTKLHTSPYVIQGDVNQNIGLGVKLFWLVFNI